MKIAFIGNHSVPYSTETHHRKTLEKMGHEVVQFQENRTTTAEVLKEAVNCDMLFWTHTHGWNIGVWEEIVSMLIVLKHLNIPTVGYHLDLWLGLEREKDLQWDAYWQIEYFFTVDKLMADYLNKNTPTKAFYLPAGVFEDECYMAEPNHKKYPQDIIFTGSKFYHKEYPYRAQLIDWLHETYGRNFAHYGNGGLPSLRGHELNVLYSSAKIVIGDTLCKNFDYPYYFSDRLFEVTGRGGFMIFPYIQGLEDMFVLGKELSIYAYGKLKQLPQTIDFYLNADSTREWIRKAGHERTKKDHTYTNRLDYILKTVFK